MKLITLNLHLWQEENQIEKLKKVAQFIDENDIDVCFFQEVAQLDENPIIEKNIKKDNNAYLINTFLNKGYYLYFEYKKNGWGIYNEGLAILSKHPLIDKRWFYISKTNDPNDWHTRIIVKATINYNNQLIDLYSSHIGWDNGEEKYFDQQEEYLKNINLNNKFILAGDFNCVYKSIQYNKWIEKGLISFVDKSNLNPYENPTFSKQLDFSTKELSNRHIDYFFTNIKNIKVLNYKIYFNEKDNLVSDHYLVMSEIKI